MRNQLAPPDITSCPGTSSPSGAVDVGVAVRFRTVVGPGLVPAGDKAEVVAVEEVVGREATMARPDREVVSILEVVVVAVEGTVTTGNRRRITLGRHM